MKSKIFFATILILFASFSALAENGKVATLINLKNDWAFPDSGKSFEVQRIATYWRFKKLGGGLDLSYKEKADYIQFKPYLTFSKGKWSLVGGGSFDSFFQYADIGIWFADRIDKFNIFVDVRNYFAISEETKDYIEIFTDLTYPINEHFFIGFDLDYVYWWKDSHKWGFVGPIFGYNINENISTYVRFSHEWDILNSKTSDCNSIRLGTILKF